MKKIGRPTKLDAERAEKIVNALRLGNTRKAACAHSGIDYTTLLNWLERGAAQRAGIFFDFLQSVKRAEADAEVRAVASLHQAMRPREILERSERQEVRMRKVRGADGSVVEEPVAITLTTVTRREEFDWRAAAFYLERRHHGDWRSRRDVDVRNLSDEQLLRLLAATADSGSDEEATGGPGPGDEEPV